MSHFLIVLRACQNLMKKTPLISRETLEHLLGPSGEGGRKVEGVRAERRRCVTSRFFLLLRKWFSIHSDDATLHSL